MGRARPLIVIAAVAFLPLMFAHAAPAASSSPLLPECTCRYKGGNAPLGSHRCLATPEGPRMAECVKELNVMSWRSSDEHCPEVSMPNGTLQSM